MTNVTACEIFNQADKKYFTLYTEWFESHFKVMLLESTSTPLGGKMNAKDVDYFCNQLSKSSDEYLQETKEILCGNDKGIEFIVQSTELEWKRNVWTLGTIKLHPVSDTKIISESFQRSLKLYQSIQEKISMLEKENKILKDIKEKLSFDIEKMIEIKTTMEQDLTKKFLILLNSKKKKLRELENALNKKESTEESIFDVRTDESEESEVENNKTSNACRPSTGIGKRKSIHDSDFKSTRKARKTDSILSTDCTVNNEISDKTSVNNADNHELQSSTSGNRKSNSSLNFIEEVSEEELFSE